MVTSHSQYFYDYHSSYNIRYNTTENDSLQLTELLKPVWYELLVSSRLLFQSKVYETTRDYVHLVTLMGLYMFAAVTLTLTK